VIAQLGKSLKSYERINQVRDVSKWELQLTAAISAHYGLFCYGSTIPFPFASIGEDDPR
jgi:hypothetical protein